MGGCTSAPGATYFGEITEDHQMAAGLNVQNKVLVTLFDADRFELWWVQASYDRASTAYREQHAFFKGTVNNPAMRSWFSLQPTSCDERMWTKVGLTLPHISNQMPLPIPSISGLGSVGADQDITIKLQHIFRGTGDVVKRDATPTTYKLSRVVAASADELMSFDNIANLAVAEVMLPKKLSLAARVAISAPRSHAKRRMHSAALADGLATEAAAARAADRVQSNGVVDSGSDKQAVEEPKKPAVNEPRPDKEMSQGNEPRPDKEAASLEGANKKPESNRAGETNATPPPRAAEEAKANDKTAAKKKDGEQAAAAAKEAKEEVAAVRKREEDEAAARKREEDEAAAAKKVEADAAARKKAEEAAAKKVEEAAGALKKEEEATARKKAEQELAKLKSQDPAKAKAIDDRVENLYTRFKEKGATRENAAEALARSKGKVIVAVKDLEKFLADGAWGPKPI